MKQFGRLYGIENTNRTGKNLWGKNQFNSAFPSSLACYMRDNDLDIVQIQLKGDLGTECVEVSVDQIFNTNLPNSDLYFDFETQFEPYGKFTYGNLERVDLVVREKRLKKNNSGEDVVVAGNPLRPLEIKLTVVPDQTTHKDDPKNWSPEIVIRPATTMYCALGMAHNPNIPQSRVNEIFLPVGNAVQDWGNQAEAEKILPKAIEALDKFQAEFQEFQTPLILQPIWRTKGKKPILEEKAFDIFVWTDFALARVFIDLAKNNKPNNISRYARSTLRLTRFLYEYGRAGAANINTIYSDMTYNQQSDKEFSLSGKITSKYMKHPRMHEPAVDREIVRKLILDNGERYLSPERRFDQTVYFTYSFEEE